MSEEGVADGGTAVDAALAFAESSPETTRRRELIFGEGRAVRVATCMILGGR